MTPNHVFDALTLIEDAHILDVSIVASFVCTREGYPN